MSQWKGYGPDNVLPADATSADPGPQTAVSAGAHTYEPYYGLKGKPFSLSTDPRALYKSPTHAAALNDLLAGIRRREGIVVLTGEMGTGKSTLCRAALYQLDRKTFTTFVPDPFLSREDLLRMLLVDFGEVSVDDLRRGRLSGASRPDLSYQLYEFLTSLESVDAFAVLVIDEAQHLGPPLLDEIRALSELEAGRRLLQIVLVGQPDLQTHLKHPQMQPIDQRVTMRCELRRLTVEDVAGYVAHRLSMVGGVQDRIAFASAGIEMIHAASKGVPRLVNLICDRALSRAHVERVSVILPPLVAGTLEELQMVTTEVSVKTPVRPVREREFVPVPPPAPSVASNLQGLFDRRRPEPPATGPSELHALLDLPSTMPNRESNDAPEQVMFGASSAPAWKWRIDSEVRRESRLTWIKSAGLALLGMGVVLFAGGIALTAQRQRSDARPSSTAPVVSPATFAPAPVAPVAPLNDPREPAPQMVAPATADVAGTAPAATPGPAEAGHDGDAPVAAPATVLPSADTWIVQVGAFASHDRSLALVQRLTQSGFQAFEVPNEASRGLMYFVRVGPFKTAGEADEARATLRQLSELESAFVRSVTSIP